jgi:hypothetical protein
VHYPRRSLGGEYGHQLEDVDGILFDAGLFFAHSEIELGHWYVSFSASNNLVPSSVVWRFRSYLILPLMGTGDNVCTFRWSGGMVGEEGLSYPGRPWILAQLGLIQWAIKLNWFPQATQGSKMLGQQRLTFW